MIVLTAVIATVLVGAVVGTGVGVGVTRQRSDRDASQVAASTITKTASSRCYVLFHVEWGG